MLPIRPTIRLMEPDSAWKRRYPNLLRNMKWVAILNDGEAVAGLRAYCRGDAYACEAIAHFGGPAAVIERAVAMRTVLRDLFRRERQEWMRYQTRLALEGRTG